MKKLFIIITLFVSSFFFISLKEVKAYELEINVNLNLLDEDFNNFKIAVENFIREDTTYSDNYLIYKYGSYLDMYAVIFPLDFTYSPNVNIKSSYLQLLLKASGSLARLRPYSNNTTASVYGTVAYNQNYTYATASNIISSRFIPLYANFDILMTKDSSLSTVTYKYNDFTTTNVADGEDKFKTLYMIDKEYQEYLGNADLEHKEEIEKIENFYNVILKKLSYLAEEIVNNYIYLSIIVVFLLILVFEFVFRRYL